MSNQPKNDNYSQVEPWATALGRQAKPTSGEYASGWNESNKVPAIKLNYLLDNASGSDLALRRILGDTQQIEGALASAIDPTVPAAGSAVRGLVWTGASWAALFKDTDSTLYSLYESVDGLNWTHKYDYIIASFYFPGRSTVVTATHLASAYSNTSNHVGIYWFTLADLTTPTVNKARDGGAGVEVRAIAVKTGGTRIMIADDEGYISTASDPTSTSWTSVATAETDIESITHHLSATWFAFTNSGSVLVTYNDGSSWAPLAGPTTDFIARSARIGSDGTHIVTSGIDDTSDFVEMFYSEDGSSWTQSVMNLENKGSVAYSSGEGEGNLIHLGGSSWAYSVGGELGALYLLVSTDNGATWSRGNVIGATTVGFVTPEIAFNGYRTFVAGVDKSLLGFVNS